MKKDHQLAFAMILIVLIATIASCGGSDSASSTPPPPGKVLTESDFIANPTLQATPADTVAVFFLEPPTDTEQAYDTQKGVDIIPYRYETGGTATFCWNDDNPDDVNAMVLRDSGGMELVRIMDNDECKMVNLAAGNYFMYLYHDERTGQTLTLFIRPDNGTSSSPASVRYDKTAYNTLISTNSCPDCNLSGAKLAGANLAGANLSYANLQNAKMKGANLSEADLSNANLNDADLTDATLSRANLSDAQLNGANLAGAKMERADLTNAMLWKANLTLANLQYANLTNAYLYETQLAGVNWTGANLSKATWYDAATCAENSIGACK